MKNILLCSMFAVCQTSLINEHDDGFYLLIVGVSLQIS